jgi:hypothetical protein
MYDSLSQVISSLKLVKKNNPWLTDEFPCRTATLSD